MTEKINKLMANGWRPDTPDFRDKKYAIVKPKVSPSKLPTSVSHKSIMGPIVDQGDIGSCTGVSTSTLVMSERIRTKETPEFRPSILFIYYNARRLEGTVSQDAGAEIRSTIKSVNQWGFCSERNWPYVESKFKQKPPERAYYAANLYKTVEYFRLDNSKINELKACLASGHAFVFGYQTYESGEIADRNGGKIPMPKTKDSSLGGHAVVCCGYDDDKKLFQIHNSWGTDCGDKGYYYLPYDYMTTTELCDDFWTIRKIKEDDNE